MNWYERHNGCLYNSAAVVLGYSFMVRITQEPHNLSFFFSFYCLQNTNINTLEEAV